MDFDEQVAWQMINPPTIPLDFTPEEIARCKSLAYSNLLSYYPNLESKRTRVLLHPFQKAQIVNKLANLFEQAVQHIRQEKG
jgi:hypothetical protein